MSSSGSYMSTTWKLLLEPFTKNQLLNKFPFLKHRMKNFKPFYIYPRLFIFEAVEFDKKTARPSLLSLSNSFRSSSKDAYFDFQKNINLATTINLLKK